MSTARGIRENGRFVEDHRKSASRRADGRSELVSEWQAQFGAPPPPKLRVELMRPVLVYRIQENAFGLSGLRRRGQIQHLASDANRRRFKTGTKIIREWKDQLNEVAVTAEGYVYNGEVYKSLSPIASRITGTRMRDLYPQVFRRGTGAILQLSARPAGRV